MKNFFSNLLTTVLVLGALIVLILAIRQEFFSPAVASVAKIPELDGWQELAKQGHVEGLADAPVKMIEFFDYQCPYCRALHPSLEIILERYRENVALIYRHLPLENHEHAYGSAIAATCAAEQGRFAPYHDLLFDNQDQLGTIPYDRLARKAEIPDLDAFNDCIEQERHGEQIQEDVRVAHAVNISSIPTLIINGKMVNGAIPLRQLDDLIQEALEEAGEGL